MGGFVERTEPYSRQTEMFVRIHALVGLGSLEQDVLPGGGTLLISSTKTSGERAEDLRTGEKSECVSWDVTLVRLSLRP